MFCCLLVLTLVIMLFSGLLMFLSFFQLQTDQFQPYYNLLKLFAYGTYRQYLENKDSLPELTAAQQQKLRHLTIVTLSETNKVSV